MTDRYIRTIITLPDGQPATQIVGEITLSPGEVDVELEDEFASRTSLSRVEELALECMHGGDRSFGGGVSERGATEASMVGAQNGDRR
jgi:hypothetical protein